jgi:chitin disaccharide deacetylase
VNAPMRQVIVNADDFGLTAGVNRAVFDAHEQGVLTSATVLVNAERAADAGDARRTRPGMRFGLHVNFSRGRPSSDPGRVRSLVDEEGMFLEPATLMRRLLRRQVDPSELYREVQSQIAALRALGVEPTHWDAHRSVAFLPGVRGPTMKAASDNGLPGARTPRIWVVEPGRSPAAARIRWRLRRARRPFTDANRLATHILVGRRFRRPDWLVSPNIVSGDSYSACWTIAFGSLPAGVSEVVSHPAYVDAELAAAEPGLVQERGADLEALLDPAVREQLREQHASLIGFGDL